MKSSNKLFTSSSLLSTLAILCASIYNTHESFELMSLGFVFIGAAIITTIIGIFKRAKKK